MLVRSEPAMIHRPSRRDIVKTAGLTAVGSLGLRCATRAQASTRLEPGTFSQIDSVLRAATSAAEVPGVVALAATANGILYEGIFGKRRLGEASVMTRDTVFRVASMVKAITSVAALQLVEQNKLSLDAPVPDIEPAIGSPQVLDGFDAKGLPQLRPAQRPITLRHLLTHTSGLAYRLWDAKAVQYAKSLALLPQPQRKLAPPTPLMFDPGTRWQYGTGINWVGRIVEAISGEPLDVYFRKHILDPLGMNDTAFVITPQQRARGQRASARAERSFDGRTDGAEFAAANLLRRRRDLFDRAGLSDLPPRTVVRRRAGWGPHPSARDRRADGPEPDRRHRRWRPENHGAGAIQRRRSVSRRHPQMGFWPHDHHAGRCRRPRRRQPDLGRPSQHILLDRSRQEDRGRLHDASVAFCRQPGAAPLPPIRTRPLRRGESGLAQRRRILDHRIRQHAEPVDFHVADIAGAHVQLTGDDHFADRLFRRFTRPQRQGARRAGDDHVAGLQGVAFRKIFDQPRHVVQQP